MAKRMKFSDDISDYFQMTTQFERKSRKFATTSTVYNVEITPFPENMIEEPLTFCQELFDRIVDELKERSDVKADDMIRVTVSHPRLDMPIRCPFMRAEALTGENIVDEIERVMQSNTGCDISDGDMSVEFMHTVLPSGSGSNRVKQDEYEYGKHAIKQEEYCQNTKCYRLGMPRSVYCSGYVSCTQSRYSRMEKGMACNKNL